MEKKDPIKVFNLIILYSVIIGLGLACVVSLFAILAFGENVAIAVLIAGGACLVVAGITAIVKACYSSTIAIRKKASTIYYENQLIKQYENRDKVKKKSNKRKIVRTCPKCGEKRTKNQKQCVFCGENFTSSSEEKKDLNNEKNDI